MAEDKAIEKGFIVLITKKEKEQIAQSIDEYLQQGKGIKGPVKRRVQRGCPTRFESERRNPAMAQEVRFSAPDVYVEVIEAVRHKVDLLKGEFSYSILVLSYDEHLQLHTVIASELDDRLELQVKNDQPDIAEPNYEVTDNVTSDFRIVVLGAIWNKLE